jgi:HK97 family phage major capsid protein
MPLTDEQKATMQERIREAAGPMVAEAVDERFKKMEEARKAAAEGSNGGAPSKGGELAMDPNLALAQLLKMGHPKAEDPRGLNFARFVGCLAAARNDPEKALSLGKKRYGDDSTVVASMAKALSAQDAESGGFLVPDEISAELIELLRPASAFRQLNPRLLNMTTGTLRIPKVTGGAIGGYIGENQNLPKSQQTVGQIVATAKKLAVLTPVSNDLIRRASISAETFVRDDLVAALAQLSDLAFIRADGSGGQPKGLKSWAAAANQLLSGTSTPGSVTLDLVDTDLGRCVQQLLDADVAIRNPGWLIEPRTWRFLFVLRDGNGNAVYRDELRGGTLWGFPFAMSTQIPRNLDFSGDTDNDETEIYFSDFADVIIAEQEGMMVDASDTAAYHDGTNIIASFSQDQTVIRAITEHDLIVRHEESVVVLNNVVYGA